MAAPTPKDRIIMSALAAADGWNMDALRRAAAACGMSAATADKLFTGGIEDATAHMTDMFDHLMLAQLQGVDTQALRVRERIARAVMTRLDLMAPYREGLRAALSLRAHPLRAARAAKQLWRSADAIWVWAGDTATDYNRYTKRALLSGVMASTLLYWLQDTSPGFAGTRAFLDRRIETVLAVGSAIHRLKPKKCEAA